MKKTKPTNDNEWTEEKIDSSERSFNNSTIAPLLPSLFCYRVPFKSHTIYLKTTTYLFVNYCRVSLSFSPSLFLCLDLAIHDMSKAARKRN